MELSELRSELRSRLDDTAEPYLWSDADLLGFLNDAVRQACIRARLLLDGTTAAVCNVTLVADTKTYALHNRVLAVRTAIVTGETQPLTLITTKWMNRRFPGWQTSSETGTPQYAIVDFDHGNVTSLRLWPTPSAAGTLQLSVWRMPLETEEMEGDSDEPVIPLHQHIDLLDWAEHRAYSRMDAETRDARRVAEAEALFTAKFGKLPSWHAIKLWGISRVRESVPQYL